MSQFPDRLRQARKDAKLTQENLAFELGVSKSQVSGWENGKETPSFKHLPKLYECLGVSLDFLLLDRKPGRIADPGPEPYGDGHFYRDQLLHQIDYLNEQQCKAIFNALHELQRRRD